MTDTTIELVPGDDLSIAINLAVGDYTGYTVSFAKITWNNGSVDLQAAFDLSDAESPKINLTLADSETSNMPMGAVSEIRVRIQSPSQFDQTVFYATVNGVGILTGQSITGIAYLGSPGANGSPGASGIAIEIGGRWSANTDNRWVTYSGNYGNHYFSHTQSAGTGIDPAIPATIFGNVVSGDQVVSKIRWFGRVNNAQVTSIDLALVHFANDGTVTQIHKEEAIAMSTAATGGTVDLGSLAIPDDGCLIASIKPNGAITAIRYVHLNISIS